MGRPKLYEDRAAKMRAYRARRADRTLEVDRSALESMESRLKRLRSAVSAAKDAGDAVSSAIDTFTLEDTIEGLTVLFERIAAASVRPPSSTSAVPSASPGSAPTPVSVFPGLASPRQLAAAVKQAPGANSTKQAARKQGRRR